MPRILTSTDVDNFRSRLCDVGARLFIEVGRDGFNMRELSTRLGVSAMTPYRYFKDKDEILAAVRAKAFGRLADALEFAHAAPGSPREKMVAVQRAYLQFALDEQAYYGLMFDLSQPQIHTLPELSQQERRARAVMTEHVCFLVNNGILEGDPELISKVLWSALHGIVGLKLASKLNSSEFDAVLSEMMRVISNAYHCAHAPESSEIERPSLSVVGGFEH